MARKNFLFADTKSGARYTSFYFSILISARMNNLNPEKYLEWLLSQLADAIRADGTIPEEVVKRCLPYASDLPIGLKISKSSADLSDTQSE